MTKQIAARVLLNLAVVFCAFPLTAVAAEAPPLAEMWYFTPRPGQAAELAEAIRAHGVFRDEQGDPRAWQVYTPALGSDMGGVGVRFCCVQWADVDAYQAWEQRNPAVMRHFLETVEPLVERTGHFFERMDWDNSHWIQDGGPYRLFAVTEMKLKVGQGTRFDAARDKMSQIAKEQGWADAGNSWLWATLVGGAPTEAIVVPYRNYADLDASRDLFPQFLATQLGAEAARELMQQMQDAVAVTDFQIWEHRPELSMPESN